MGQMIMEKTALFPFKRSFILILKYTNKWDFNFLN